MVNRTVSVIIPLYNSSGTIEACLRSVLAQSISVHEIIVIDDGSTDDSLQIIQTLKQNDQIDNLLIYQQENSGPSAARNLGISVSSGEFIAFLDSDDTWLETKLEKQMICFDNHSEVGIIGTNYRISNTKVNETIKKPPKVISFHQLLFKNYFVTSSVVIRRSALGSNLFNERKRYSEDYELWLRLTYSSKALLIPEPLVVYCKPLVSTIGLSARLIKMTCGELNNYIRMYHEKKINLIIIVLIPFSLLKHCKRIFQVLILKYFSG